MSVEIMGKVWHTNLRPNLMLVLQAMADHADDEGNNVYPGVGLIARKTNYSCRNVQRLQQELRRLGILVVVERAAGPGRGGGLGRPKKYRIELSALPKRDDNMAHVSGEKDVTAPAPVLGKQTTPRVETDDTTGTKETTPRAPVRTEPSVEPSGRGTSASVPARDGDEQRVPFEADSPQERTAATAPAEVQEVAFKIFGHLPSELAQWYEFYPLPWIPLALERTRRNGKTAPAYTRAILEAWRKAGGPDDGATQFKTKARERDRKHAAFLEAETKRIQRDIKAHEVAQLKSARRALEDEGHLRERATYGARQRARARTKSLRAEPTEEDWAAAVVEERERCEVIVKEGEHGDKD